MAAAVERKPKISKRSTNSYATEEWSQHRPLITRLYFEEGRTLKDVRECLERQYGFSPTERMYKSRLHAWGLDKKKKEHEMLDVVRMGLQTEGNSKDKIFTVRGRQVTLADALHYFNRKGIKDPTSLLESQPESSGNLSSPDDGDARTPASSHTDQETGDSVTVEASDKESMHSPLRGVGWSHLSKAKPRPTDFVERQLAKCRIAVGSPEVKPLPSFRNIPLDAVIPPVTLTTAEKSLLEAILQQTQNHYRALFASRNFSVNNMARTWTATSDDAPADKFYYIMYNGYAYLWNKQRDKAFDEFYKAFALVESLLRDEHVSFLIYLFDLTVRYDETGLEEPLFMLWKHVSDMATTVFGSQNNPITLIATWVTQTTCSRPTIAEGILRRLVDFFQDSLGYFHPETIALLQTFANALLNRKHYQEAMVRYHQLVDAHETTRSKLCFEACYSLRILGDVYFHMDRYGESLQTLKLSLDRSETLPRIEEREIHLRCVRGIAEIYAKVGRRDDALECMRYVVDTCLEDFGPDHHFTLRARMHLKSMEKGEADGTSTIPFSVHHLGRGGRASKYIWVSRTSPTRLEA